MEVMFRRQVFISRNTKKLSRLFSRWTWVSQCLLKQRMMEVVVTTGAISRAKLQSNHHHQQTSSSFYRPDGLPVAQPTVSKHYRENIIPMDMPYRKLTWGLPTLSLTTNSSWLPWRRVAMPLISPLMPVHEEYEEKTTHKMSQNSVKSGTWGHRRNH